MKYNSTEYYYIFNIFGDVIYLLNNSGDIMVEYRYDAFGNITDTIDNSTVNLADANPYRYRGYRFDEETNLYYLNSRYYNPVTGRFMNADGMLKASNTVLGHNMFIYTENNPVMNVDPSGYNCDWYDESTGTDNSNTGGGGGCGGKASVNSIPGGLTGNTSTHTTSGSAGVTSGGTTSVGNMTGSSHHINDIFPTGINSGLGSYTSGYYAPMFYNNNGVYIYGVGQYYNTVTAAQTAHINNLIRFIESHNMQPPKFYKGKGPYLNSNGKLPSNYTYTEYRVYKTPGSTERLVYQNETGVWLYTGSHYDTFITWR